MSRYFGPLNSSLRYLRRLLPKSPGHQTQVAEAAFDRTVEFVPIVSFPRSGNTYCRAIIARLLFGEPYFVIPDIHRENVEIGRKFPLGQRSIQLFKSHWNRNIASINGKQIRTAHVVWIRRHPLDVFLSFRNYLLLQRNQVPDVRLWTKSPFCGPYLRSRKELSDQEDLANMFACFLVYGTLMPGLHGAGNWFDHTRYWWEYSRSNACFPIKYEDLVEDPVRSLSGFAKELGFGDSDLERAVTLANQDTRIDGQFFWKQRVNHHLEMLPAALIEKWYGMYGDEMKAFGYPPPHSMRPASADREPN